VMRHWYHGKPKCPTVCAARLQLSGKNLSHPQALSTTAHFALWGIYTHPITTCNTRATIYSTNGRISKQSEHTITRNKIAPMEGIAHSCELSYIGRLPRYVRSPDVGSVSHYRRVFHIGYIYIYPTLVVHPSLVVYHTLVVYPTLIVYPNVVIRPTSVGCPSLVGGPILALYQTSVVYHTRVVYPAPFVDLSVLDQSFSRRLMFGVRLSTSPVSA